MGDFHWKEFPDDTLPVFGLAWFAENSPELWRLPGRLENVVRPEVWELALAPSGGRIRFAGDTTAMAVRLSYEDLTVGENFSKIGQAGLALYADGYYWRPVFPETTGECELTFFENAPKVRREFTIYLPLYKPVKVLALGLDPGATVWAPEPFAVDKPVAFYGSSITQGGCASQAGMSYQAILGRRLNIDFVNLGFSGQGRGERELAEAFCEIDASAYVVDFAQNCPTTEELGANYPPFLDVIRRGRPDVPVICVTPIYSTLEMFDGERLAQNTAKRDVIRQAVAARIAAGDGNITLVEGLSLIGESEGHFTVDGAHPNDLGFNAMAEGLSGAVADALGLEL